MIYCLGIESYPLLPQGGLAANRITRCLVVAQAGPEAEREQHCKHRKHLISTVRVEIDRRGNWSLT